MTLARQIEQRVIDWLQGMDQQSVTIVRAINKDKFPLPVVAVSVDVGEPINSVFRQTYNCTLTVSVRVHVGDVGDTDQCEQIADDMEFILSDVDSALEAIPECLRFDYTGLTFDWDESVMVGELTADMIARRVI